MSFTKCGERLTADENIYFLRGGHMLANGMDFVNDEAVIGKWDNIGWIEDLKSYTIEKINAKSNEYENLYFLPNGEPYWIFEGWTKGFLLIHYGGDEPVLTYKYEIRDINGKSYLFLRLDNKTEIFVKVSSQHYNKETLGNHDNIDLPFVYDDNVIGIWNSVGFVDKIEDFSPDKKVEKLYLKSIEFNADGSAIQKYMDDEWQDKWTKGYLLNIHRTTAAAYEIHNIDGIEYLFLQWKMGNYIYGGIKPSFYVFAR